MALAVGILSQDHRYIQILTVFGRHL